MSHIAVQTTKPGEPMFADMACLRQAVEMLGCRIVERNTFRWYGSSVGDYPLPLGMKKEDLGKNAKFVIELTPETQARIRAEHPEYDQEAYDVGLIEDPNNPGTYVPMYDHFINGYGVDDVLGSPIRDPNHYSKVLTLLPKLMQHYHMCCDAAAAREVGDAIEFLTAKAAHSRYPELFPTPTTDETTWVSIADTTSRIGVN